MNKYRNVPCKVGSEKYRSKREAARHQELLLLQKAGQISHLRREVTYVLADGYKAPGAKRAVPALRYVADFVYWQAGASALTIEDAKGISTQAYRVKRHLMYTVHGVHILET